MRPASSKPPFPIYHFTCRLRRGEIGVAYTAMDNMDGTVSLAWWVCLPEESPRGLNAVESLMVEALVSAHHDE